MVDLRELIQKVSQAKDKLELQNLKSQFLGKNSQINQEFKKQSLNTPIMSASGLSQVTCPLAISSGASAVGVGSVVNRLDDLISYLFHWAIISGLKIR